MSHTLTIRLTRELALWLEDYAKRAGVSQGQIVRDQLERAKSGADDRAFLQLAGTIEGPKDLSERRGFSRP